MLRRLFCDRFLFHHVGFFLRRFFGFGFDRAGDHLSILFGVGNLKVGDMVRVSYAEKDGKMTASSVKAETKKATEKKADVMEKKPATK